MTKITATIPDLKEWPDRRAQWGFVFLVATMLGLLNFGVNVTDELANNYDTKWTLYLVTELSGAYTIILLLPPLVWFFQRFPLLKEKFYPRLLMYLLVSVIFGLAHTALMFIVRVFLYDWFEFGSYMDHYGILKYRVVMEYFKQFLFFWLFYGGYRFFQKIRENQRQRLRSAQLEQQLAQAQLQTLQMQLNPHFLFNTLNMVSSLMYEEPDKADQMIINLSEMLRLSLQRSGKMEHSLAQELDWLQKYIEIMHLRFGEQLKIEMKIAPETRSASIPVFLLQPILENAIKYSAEQVAQTSIAIKAMQEKEKLLITVTDNGPGLSPSSKWGVGLNNTIERLEKRFGENYFFKLKNKAEGGVEAILKIPFLPLSL